MIVDGCGGEIIGGIADVTGVETAAGVSLNIASAAGIAYGIGVTAISAGNFYNDSGNMFASIERSEGTGKVIDDLPTGGKIKGYTKHGTEQALRRDGGIGVSNKAITDAVNNPVKPPVSQTGGTIKYIGKDATVVLNQDGKVVTTWANSSAGTR